MTNTTPVQFVLCPPPQGLAALSIGAHSRGEQYCPLCSQCLDTLTRRFVGQNLLEYGVKQCSEMATMIAWNPIWYTLFAVFINKISIIAVQTPQPEKNNTNWLHAAHTKHDSLLGHNLSQVHGSLNSGKFLSPLLIKSKRFEQQNPA